MREKILKRPLSVTAIMVVVVISVVLVMSGTTPSATVKPVSDSSQPETCAGGYVRIFMEIPEIPGKSEVAGHEDQIEIIRYSQGIYRSQSTDARSRMGTHQPFTVVKMVDKTTPKLYERVVKGTHITEVFLKFYRSCPALEEAHYFTIHLEDVSIVSVRSYLASNPASIPLDEVTFTYSKITWTWLSEQGKVEASAEVEPLLITIESKLDMLTTTTP